MKSLINQFYRLSFFIIVLIAVSCHKDDSLSDRNEEVYAVNFKFFGFTNQLARLSSLKQGPSKFANSAVVTQNYSEGYLYYWSFNADNLVPDIRFNTQLSPNIVYSTGEVPNSFVNSTYTYENFAAGRALTFSGNKEILFKLPIQGVDKISTLGFDVGSPGTGPKDFELFYSIDKGLSYLILSNNNQFGNPNTANQKHTYSYDLRDQNIVGKELWFKIIPKAGERGTSNAFNENSGIMRMDNLYLTGIASTSQPSASIDKIHYFLFDKNNSNAVISGERDLNNSSSFELSIPKGNYNICFIANTSNEELLLPANITKESLYASNLFSNYAADIYAYTGDLIVNQVQTNQIELTRFFSQIKIEFTDNQGLEQVTKIVIDQVHEPFFYVPFGSIVKNPVVDQSSIVFTDNFELNKQVVFNQFLGNLASFRPINYSVQVYSGNTVLRTFILSSSLKNNMQLVFRGNILEVFNNTFNILKNENWDGLELVGF